MKRAVVLLNLGGPLKAEDIRPFLFNFFRDKRIITLPNPFRFLLAGLIAVTRSKGAAKESYGRLGGKSPLLENTQAQASALEKLLPDSKVFIAMRHWHPFADETVKEVAAYGPDEIVLLPLYPQYSTTTTLSAFEDWDRAAKSLGVPTKKVVSYQTAAGFIEASAALIAPQLKPSTRQRLLFSAHGLPEQIIRAGDPYQRQCEETAAAIVQKLNIPGLDWELCYQSRVGRLKWIGPSIDESMQKAAKEGLGVVVYPLAFVSEHVETLVELDIEYKHKAEELGMPSYTRVPTVSTHPSFIETLRNLVLSSST